MEHMADICPFVQILDAPVPQPVDNVTDALSKCPRCLAYRVLLVLLFLSRSQRNSWWRCRPSCLLCASRSRSSAFQFLRVVSSGVFKGSLPRQSSTAAPSSVERISARIVEQIVDISPSGGLGQGLASPAGAADEDFTVFFALFPMEKSAECRAGGDCAARWASQLIHAERSSNASCWRRFALILYGVGAVWNRRTHETARQPPAGVNVVWMGTMDEEGDYYYWHKKTRVSTYVLPPLPG